MRLKLTERDKRLLIGLLFFCMTSGLIFLLILPLCAANQEWKTQIASQEGQIAVLRQKTEQLPALRAEYEREKKQMEERQALLYPLMEAYEIDGLLTGQIAAAGVQIQKMKIKTVSDDKRTVQKNRISEENGGIFQERVELKLLGTRDKLEALIGEWCSRMPGIRIAGFTWEPDHSGQELEILQIQLEIRMYGKETKGDSRHEN